MGKYIPETTQNNDVSLRTKVPGMVRIRDKGE
jgi:hypothetical protein